MKKLLLIAACVVGMGVSQVGRADSITYGFYGLTWNSAGDVAIGVSQLSVKISSIQTDPTQVLFTFLNSGSDASSITDVYFDDGALLGIASIVGSQGVSFSQGASPGNLPGGQEIGFSVTSGFLADSDSPAQPNGVNPGEWLQIYFNLVQNKTYADVITAIELAAQNPGEDVEGGLRIGIHVQGFTSGGSESFVNRVPDGGLTAAMLGLGVLGVGYMARRKS